MLVDAVGIFGAGRRAWTRGPMGHGWPLAACRPNIEVAAGDGCPRVAGAREGRAGATRESSERPAVFCGWLASGEASLNRATSGFEGVVPRAAGAPPRTETAPRPLRQWFAAYGMWADDGGGRGTVDVADGCSRN